MTYATRVGVCELSTSARVCSGKTPTQWEASPLRSLPCERPRVGHRHNTALRAWPRRVWRWPSSWHTSLLMQKPAHDCTVVAGSTACPSARHMSPPARHGAWTLSRTEDLERLQSRQASTRWCLLYSTTGARCQHDGRK